MASHKVPATIEKGKGRGAKIDRDEYFARLQPFLELGYSLHKASLLSEVPYRTVKDWYEEKDGEFANKVERERRKVNAVARKVWYQKIASGNYQAAKEWLERIEKDELGQSLDITSGGEALGESETVRQIAKDLTELVKNGNPTSPTADTSGEGDSQAAS